MIGLGGYFSNTNNQAIPTTTCKIDAISSPESAFQILSKLRWKQEKKNAQETDLSMILPFNMQWIFKLMHSR